MAHVPQRHWPAAVAGRLEEIIRTCVWLVFALQETKITVSRLRRLLFGKVGNASAPAPEDAVAPRPASGDEPNAGVVLTADAADAAATTDEAPPPASPSPPQGKPKGGHRPGTGSLGADAYVGAERVDGRHEDLAPGQRCPGCGQGPFYELPPGGEMRLDGRALLRARR